MAFWIGFMLFYLPIVIIIIVYKKQWIGLEWIGR